MEPSGCVTAMASVILGTSLHTAGLERAVCVRAETGAQQPGFEDSLAVSHRKPCGTGGGAFVARRRRQCIPAATATSSRSAAAADSRGRIGTAGSGEGHSVSS